MRTIEKTVMFVKKHMRILLVLADIVGMAISCYVAMILKFDASTLLKDWFDNNIIYIMAVDLVSTAVMFIIFKIYNRMWQYMVVSDYVKMGYAYIISKIITVIPFFYIWLIPSQGPKQTRSFFTWMFIYSCLLASCVIFSRILILFGYRAWRNYLAQKEGKSGGKKKNVMIIGAGGTAIRLIQEFHSSTNIQNRYNVVALIDDNKRKHGSYLHGIKIYGGRDKILDLSKELDVDEIFFAANSADKENRKYNGNPFFFFTAIKYPAFRQS